MVTVVLSVLLHEALHKVDRCHVTGLGQQVAGVSTGRDQINKHKGQTPPHQTARVNCQLSTRVNVT